MKNLVLTDDFQELNPDEYMMIDGGGIICLIAAIAIAVVIPVLAFGGMMLLGGMSGTGTCNSGDCYVGP